MLGVLVRNLRLGEALSEQEGKELMRGGNQADARFAAPEPIADPRSARVWLQTECCRRTRNLSMDTAVRLARGTQVMEATFSE
jgi:hypothetical protein